MSRDYRHSDLPSLLKYCLSDDRRAQNELYQRYYSHGMGIAMRYTADLSQSKAILNDAFYKIFRSIDRYDSSREFGPWFSRVVVNTALSHLKQQSRHAYMSFDETFSEPEVASDAIANISYQEMISMVQTLSTSYRTVFNLYVIEGYKHEEIAAQLGISVGTSKSNLARAKANLRKLIEKHFSPKHV